RESRYGLPGPRAHRVHQARRWWPHRQFRGFHAVDPRLALGTPYAPMTERDAVRIRRLLLIVADASQGPNGDWTLHEAGPSGVDLARSATDAAVDSAARYAADALGRMIQEWQDSVIAFRCGLKPADVIRLGGPAQW